MKDYFIKKLTNIKEDIVRLQTAIIAAATEMEMRQLVSLPSKLAEYNAKHRELTIDFCTYCSVDDVIEVSKLVDRYSQESLNLLNKRDIEHFYQYVSKGVSLEDRKKLVERFGYSLERTNII